MSECEISKTLKFSAGDEVFFLSKNLRRIERGIVEGARIAGDVYLEGRRFYNSALVYYQVYHSNGKRQTCLKLESGKVFATREEAAAYRKTAMNCQFDQLNSSIRNYISILLQIPQSALEGHRRKTAEELKKIWEEFK